MQLIILGKNSDDKGTQLEKLTSSILKEEGYTQIRTNVVKSGASEIDITAVFSQQYFGNTLVREVIGECKAYNKPIALPDWLKFLGKVFSEEVNDKQIQGCFIALSGVNGNVTGHYNNIKAKRPDIILLSGESLLDILKTHFEVISIEEILALIPLFTTRRPINYVICYYNERFYWRVTFSENSYTLLSHDGKTLENNDAIKLHQLVTRESDLLKYIDLQLENDASERSFILAKYVLNTLLIDGMTLNEKELHKSCIAKFGSNLQKIKLSEIRASLSELISSKIILKNREGFYLKIFDIIANVDDVAQFYSYFFYRTAVLQGLMSDNYYKKIDKELLDHILKVQGGVIIPSDKYKECLQILVWSPSVLEWGLRPDPNIINHRSNGVALTPDFEKHDTDYFIRQFYGLLLGEFKNSQMAEYFFKRGIKEIETSSNIIIKAEESLQIENLSKERIAIFKMTEEYNHQAVLVNLLEDEKYCL